MRWIYLYFLILLGLNNFISAQNLSADSLLRFYINKSDSIASQNTRQALEFSKMAYEIAKTKSDSNFITSISLQMAELYKRLAIMDSAKLYIYSAFAIAKQNNNYDELIKAYIALGELNRAMYHADTADVYIRSALNLSFENKIYRYLPEAYNRMAAIYFEKYFNKNLSPDTNYFYKSINYVDSSFYYAEITNDSSLNISNYNILGACYSSMKNYEKSNYYLKLAKLYAERTGAYNELPVIYKNIGKNYLITKQYTKAIETGIMAAKLADKMELQELSYFAYKIVYSAYFNTGNYKKALEYHLKVDSISELSLKKNSDRRLKEFKAEYETRESKIRLKNQALRIKYQTVVIVIVLIIFLITLVMVILIYKQGKKIKKVNTELSKRNARISELVGFQRDMTSMLVHDLKNPLDIIINCEAGTEPVKQLEKVKKIGKQMVHMVLNILDINRYEDIDLSLNKSRFLFSSVVDEAIADIDYVAGKKNINIQKNLDTDYLILGDKELIKRVMVNLLTNAIKFSHFEGKVEIKTSLCCPGFISVSVIDYGVGIRKDKLNSIFDKYVQVDYRKSGSIVSSGLGLAFCKLAVEAHGGTIKAQSEKGVQTVFSFTLPVLEQTQLHSKKEKNKQKTEFSNKEINYLNEFIEKYKEISIFDVISLRKLTNEIDESYSENIRKAKKKIEKIIYNCDEASYEKLISGKLFYKNSNHA